MGDLQLNTAGPAALGLTGINTAQANLLSGMVLAQPVPACLAALALLKISPVNTSVRVEYINSKPPSKRLAMVNWAGDDIQRTQAATELYMHRLPRHDDLTFEQYFSTYIVDTNPEHARICDQHSSQDLLTRQDKNRGEALPRWTVLA
jgi:hypothetical protein